MQFNGWLCTKIALTQEVYKFLEKIRLPVVLHAIPDNFVPGLDLLGQTGKKP